MSEYEKAGADRAVDLLAQCKQLQAENKQLEKALEDMCYQFAGWSRGGYSTDGLSALEGAFDVLGWPNPKICKASQCDEPKCKERATCGFPTDNGYRRTCSKHSKI